MTNTRENLPVLDHGYVRLVGSMGTDETIIEAARMSSGKGFTGWEQDVKLLTYLYRNQHMTPFEMCELAIEVQAPLFVVREWQRSRTQSYNELSARYTQMPDLHYVPSPERMARQSTLNKQGSGETLPAAMAESMCEGLREEQATVYRNYAENLDIGLSREVARINTPVSRYTRFRAKANLRNWLHFLQLRLDPAAQFEIRQYAHAVGQLVQELWPRTWALFEEYDLYGKRLSRAEYAEFLLLRAAVEARSPCSSRT